MNTVNLLSIHEVANYAVFLASLLGFTTRNRMPLAEEMEEFASVFLDKRKDRLKGLGWYCYRQAADNYLAWLHKDRFDESNADRWEVLRQISMRF